MDDIEDIIQQVGGSKYISKFDAKSGYHQCPVKVEDRWLTAFVFENEIYQWCRIPFGLKGSGDSFVKALRFVLKPIRQFTKNFVDDMCVHSDEWLRHLNDVNTFLCTLSRAGITLGLSKCEFAQHSVKFSGHIIGSGFRGVDPDKVYVAIQKLKIPENKKELRSIIGLFSFFFVHIYRISVVLLNR
jgi:hypothetical protein